MENLVIHVTIYISTLHNLEDGKNQNNILIDYK